jgi:hypothetical protein
MITLFLFACVWICVAKGLKASSILTGVFLLYLVLTAIFRIESVYLLPIAVVYAVFAIIAFYYLGNYQPMLWCAGIAVLAQFFCKPSDRKIYLEINNKNEEDL